MADSLAEVSSAPTSLMVRLDAVVGGLVCLFTIAVALYMAPRGFHAGLVDFGHDGYQLRTVTDLADGGILFRDTFTQYGPFADYTSLIGYELFGGNLLALKNFVALTYGAAALLNYALCRRFLSIFLSAVACSAWLLMAPFYQHGIMISPHAYALPFQFLSILLMLRWIEHRRTTTLLLVGIVCGIVWGFKQSIGIIHTASIAAFLVVVAIHGLAVAPTSRERDRATRGALIALVSFAAGASAVVVLVLSALYASGALRDWYLQTISFPKDFYLQYYVGTTPTYEVLAELFGAGFARGERSRSLLLLSLWYFETVNAPSVAFYWTLMRFVIVVAALRQLFSLKPDLVVVLLGVTGGMSWLGAWPSHNYMHQWWTAGPCFAAFVLVLARWLSARRGSAAEFLTAGLVAFVFANGVLERVRAATVAVTEPWQGMGKWSSVIETPYALRGIRTDPATKDALESVYALLRRYRDAYPKIRVVTRDDSDGASTGPAMALPLIGFLDGNRSVHPVYWPLPVLSTRTYPDFGPRMDAMLADERPLIVNYVAGSSEDPVIPGYRIAARFAMGSHWIVGDWVVWAPEDRPLPSSPSGPAPLYVSGTPVEAGAPVAEPFLRSGWWRPEPWGVWSTDRGELHLRLAEVNEPPGLLELTLSADGVDGRAERLLRVSANGRPLGTFDLGGDGVRVLEIPLPDDLPTPAGELVVGLESIGAEGERCRRIAAPEARCLGIGLVSFRLHGGGS